MTLEEYLEHYLAWQDMLKFCGEQGFNAYIYAPKNDPYHKDRWREPYPKKEQKKLKELARTAGKHHVELIFAISPGQDLHYSGPEGIADRKVMLEKLEAMHDLGIRRFAIFFDDIKGMTEKSSVDAEDARNQAEFINEVQKKFRAAHEARGELGLHLRRRRRPVPQIHGLEREGQVQRAWI